MVDRTSEQVLKDEQQKLGRDQGKAFNTLKNNIFLLDVKWKEFKILYCNSKNVEILNKTASFYFYMNQQIMLDDIVLHISKIASARGKTYPYLSIRRLPDFVKQKYKDELQVLVDDAVAKTSFVRDRRNRYIAHYSLDLIINKNARPLNEIKPADIDNAIDAFKDIIVFVYTKILNAAISKDVIYPLDNANALLRRLKKTI
jgi:hypothetical protein